MGFEVVFDYHERDDEGNYKKDEVKQLKRKIGDPYDDIPLEKLASAVMSQLARRDIWVVSVDIHEYKKQKISFRETKGGIVIKNKKFSLDNEANIVMQDIKEETSMLPAMNGGAVPTTITQLMPHNTGPLRVIKWVALDPDIPNLHNVRKRGLQFTEKKRYPVFQETPNPKQLGVYIYKTVDDQKREVMVSSEYFLPADVKLEGGNFEHKALDEGPTLMYEGQTEAAMPDIRR